MENIIYLKAYFRKNLGDDMFVMHLVNRYPNVIFKIYAHRKYVVSLKKIRNVKVVPMWVWCLDRLLERCKRKKIGQEFFVKNTNIIVHIGGSIFIEPENFQLPDNVIYPSNIFYIGCNFGPYNTKKYYDYIYKRLSCAQDTCFRDSYSYAKFRTIKHTRIAPDILWGYKDYPTIKKGDGIGISVIDLSFRKDLVDQCENYYSTIAKLIDLCAAKSLKVKLFGFCVEEGDDKAISEILAKIHNGYDSKIEIVKYNGDIEWFLEKFNECEYIIASRFHAMIIAWRLRKKVFPIIYSQKQENVLNDLGYSASSWNLLKMCSYSADELLFECLNSNKMEEVDWLAKKSEEHFLILDKYIAKPL